jgi:hypothetical protein
MMIMTSQSLCPWFFIQARRNLHGSTNVVNP